jgi:probable phosphoglycerate mutase
MKLYLIRHGDPDYENDTLTERGHQEAMALATYLQREGIDQIVSSPLGRARDTAQYTANAIGVEMSIEPWMAELSLPSTLDDRRSAWDTHGEHIRNARFLNAGYSLEHIPGVPAEETRSILESMRSESDRFLATLGYVRDDGVYRIEQPNRLRIAIFAHGGFGLFWLSLLLEIPPALVWSGFFFHTSSVTQILFDERSDSLATPRCLMMSALPHLYAESLEPGRAGIQANYS